MTRPTYRRTPRLENLEKREVLNGPTADQQYMLELLNLARTNPAAAADRITSDLDPTVSATLKKYNLTAQDLKNWMAHTSAQPPFAWSDQLASAAQAHSQDEANSGKQSHSGSDGSDLNRRLDQAGSTNRTSQSENTFAYATSIDEAMQAFLFDWGVSDHGHFNNIMEPGTPPDQARRDVGIGIVNNVQMPNYDGKTAVITQDFGSQSGEKGKLLGVAFDDRNGDNFYEPGEGHAGITIDATNEATGHTTSTQTMDAGDYQMALDPGKYKITAHVGDQIIRTQEIDFKNVNMKVDYNLSQPWQGKQDNHANQNNYASQEIQVNHGNQDGQGSGHVVLFEMQTLTPPPAPTTVVIRNTFNSAPTAVTPTTVPSSDPNHLLPDSFPDNRWSKSWKV